MNTIFSKFIFPILISGSFMFVIYPDALSARGEEHGGGEHSGGQFHGGEGHHEGGEYHGGAGEGHQYDHHYNEKQTNNIYNYEGGGRGGNVYVAPQVGTEVQPVYYDQSEWDGNNPPPPYEPGENY